MADAWKRADELISDAEEELIDTPATIAAFGDPELRGVDAMADVPFPLQTIEDPPDILDEEEESELEGDVDEIQDVQEIQDAGERGAEEPAGVTGPEVTPEREQAREGEEDDMARNHCDDCGRDFPTAQGLALHRTRIHGGGRKRAATRPRRGRPRRRQTRPGTKVSGTVAVQPTGSSTADELDRVRGIMLAIEQLSAPAQHYLRYLLEQETA